LSAAPTGHGYAQPAPAQINFGLNGTHCLFEQENTRKLSEEKMKKQWIAIGITAVVVSTLYTIQMAKAKRNKPPTVNPVTP
jgi:hypothetical protein